jgi:hypothetical protein
VLEKAVAYGERHGAYDWLALLCTRLGMVIAQRRVGHTEERCRGGKSVDAVM